MGVKQVNLGKFFHYYNNDGIGWFRLIGVGLHWKDTSKLWLRYSERNERRKAIKIGAWRISFLPCSRLS